MNFTVRHSGIRGRVRAPSSKSDTHRALACAALAEGETRVVDALACDDTNATADACRALGVQVSPFESGQSVSIHGSGGEFSAPAVEIGCGGSGTTIRFFTALSALAPAGSSCTLTGNESLRKRPVGVLLEALTSLGVACASENGLPPVRVKGGGIAGGCASIPGTVSSQFVSALLLACPEAKEDTDLAVTGGLQSKPYVAMTLATLRRFGGRVAADESMGAFHIPSRQRFLPCEYRVEGDYSSAAFLLSAGALAGRVEVGNLRGGSLQGDARIVGLLEGMGALVTRSGDAVSVGQGHLHALRIDASDIPDLVPVLAALATQADGETRIVNAGRLRLKESDRLATTTSELSKMGASIKEEPEGLLIRGPSKLHGAAINPHGDHRIAMACAVAALVASGETVITDADCVSKSYPAFKEDFKRIGADVT